MIARLKKFFVMIRIVDLRIYEAISKNIEPLETTSQYATIYTQLKIKH